MIATAVEAALLALALDKSHPDFMAAKVDMDQKIAALTEEEKQAFSAELDNRLGYSSFRPS